MSLPVMKNFINGEWVDSDTTIFGDVCNPAKGEKIATVPFGTAQDVDRRGQRTRSSPHTSLHRLGNCWRKLASPSCYG